MERCQVIENPERPPMGSDHEIVVFDNQIIDRYHRQIALHQLQRVPSSNET
jgi:hypothetical protein